nr:hypothetical protein [Tanacetum cinerariifolium]
SWVNERQMQTTEEEVDTSKALDASLVDTESSGTDTKEQDTSSSSGNDAHDDDADIRPIYDEEPTAKVKTTTEINIFATGQQNTEQPEFNNEGKVDQNAAECHDTCPFPAILTDNQIPDHSYQSLKPKNICLKKTVAYWVNERQMQTTEEEVDTSKALDASLVDTESNGTDTKEQDTSSSSGNDAHDDDADIKPIYDEEPTAKVKTTAEINIFATGQQHTEQPEFNNKGKVNQNAEECHETCPLPAILTDNQIPDHSYQSLESKNICLKKTVA